MRPAREPRQGQVLQTRRSGVAPAFCAHEGLALAKSAERSIDQLNSMLARSPALACDTNQLAQRPLDRPLRFRQ